MSSNIERCVTLDKISGNCVNKLSFEETSFFFLKFRIHFWERFVLFASLRETGFSGKWGFPLGKVFKNRTYEKIYVSTDWGSSLTFGEKYKPCACFLPTNPHPVSESNHFVIAFRTSWYLQKVRLVEKIKRLWDFVGFSFGANLYRFIGSILSWRHLAPKCSLLETNQGSRAA